MAEKSKGLFSLTRIGALIAIPLVLAIISLLVNGLASGGREAQSGALEQLALAGSGLSKLAAEALQGKDQGWQALEIARRELADAGETLADASGPGLASPAGIGGSDGAIAGAMAALDGLLAARQRMDEALSSANRVDSEIPRLLSETGIAVNSLGPRAEIAAPLLSRFERHARELAPGMRELVSGAGNAQAVSQRLREAESYMDEFLRGLDGAETSLGVPSVRPGQAESSMEYALSSFRQIQGELGQLLTGEELNGVDALLSDLETAATQLGLRVKAARAELSKDAGLLTSPWVPLALVVLALLALLPAIWVNRSGDQLRAAAARHAEQNERNQEAILRLLDELTSLADGDLTVQATVTEDITGTVADSINYAIEALRELVTTINDSAIMVDAAAKQTKATASHLAKASEQQSHQISAATDSVAQMAASIEQVSGNAERSADVARHSVDVAHKGGDAVRRTIEGMNAIRETIQETSKRIKRLGESSQEIGNIVELINDIAEQTNILALNASIQASMAGEAGRGFAVVADEVQRLAERSANATKQIEVLVRTIQSDTNEAVVSMERSTTDVVGGALLAENAGAALEEIEQVSNQIASLVQNISGTARQLNSASGDIASNMSVLREISSQTAESTSATSDSIGKLSELATQLRTSVAGFRLPDFGSGTAVLREMQAKAPGASGQTRRQSSPGKAS